MCLTIAVQGINGERTALHSRHFAGKLLRTRTMELNNVLQTRVPDLKG